MMLDPSRSAPPSPSIAVLLVDDHRLFRAALRALIERDANLRVVGEATTGAEAIRFAAEHAVDFVVMDVHLPDMTGVAASRCMLERDPQLKILAVTSDPSATHAHEAMVAGVAGYILKENSSDEFERAVRAVLAGKVYLCPEVSTSIMENYRQRHIAPEKPRTTLSEREVELVRLIANGMRNKEIAEQLNLTVKSAETYRQRILKKLNLDSTAALTRYAVREEIVKP